MKEKVEKEKGAETFPAAGQKLIYAGMQDARNFLWTFTKYAYFSAMM